VEKKDSVTEASFFKTGLHADWKNKRLAPVVTKFLPSLL
jgi:hypothetical protein